MTEFFPGFDVDVDVDVEAPPPAEQLGLRDERPGTARDISANTFACRVTWFLRSLSPARRAEINRRARFYRLPWIRPADEADDDFLP